VICGTQFSITEAYYSFTTRVATFGGFTIWTEAYYEEVRPNKPQPNDKDRAKRLKKSDSKKYTAKFKGLMHSE
jgi:hypothetical protein